MKNVTDIMCKMDQEKVIQLLEDALVAWRTKQTRARQGVSISQFAEYLGVSKSLFIAWQGKQRPMTLDKAKRIAKPIADLVGTSAYEILDVTPPNPYLQKIISVFENISSEHQRKLSEDAELYKVENLEEHIQTTSQRRTKRKAD